MFDFLPFGRNKTTDPLSSLKALTNWINNELPMGDMYTAHEKITQCIVELNNKTDPFSKDRLQMLMQLDEQGVELQESLCQQYLQNPRMSRVIESRLWNSIHAYYWETTRGYHAFIMDYVGNPSGSKIKSLLPKITARAINYFGMTFKWNYFRYEQLEPKMWKRLHNLYHFAEYEEFDHEPIKLYDVTGKSATCTDLYVQALMLNNLNTGSLFPKQIDMVSMWLEEWSSSMTLKKVYDPAQHVFCVDLSTDRGGKRIRKMQNNDMQRYWGTHDLVCRIERVKTKLLKGDAPARLGLGEACRLPGCLEFLDDLMRHWAPTVTRVNRLHARTTVVKMIEVVHEVEDIFGQVRVDNELALLSKKPTDTDIDKGALSYDEMVDVRLYGFVTKRTQAKLGAAGSPLDQQQVAHHERWVMENESEGGYGATLNVMGNDWIRLDKLVGLKPERSGQWQIGVVRRLSKPAAGQLYVGIEVLVKLPIVVTLHAKQLYSTGYAVDGVDAADMLLPIAGVYVPKDDENHFPNSLVVDPSEYAPDRVLELAAGKKRYMIRLTDVLEKGDDWLRVAFVIVVKAKTS
ncbi:hypothetical protein [Sulfurirhabdus autotrophica]|uniref:Uncharacterized protein n=1 Tax=Sulfurirhabdus autotrophica TaxID=1706046 RepID=A0A4R3Y3M2_9PROT|nr:hypothetical protein [Sulfurirhabdus autotrophica]TCV85338.1 hypothetical protein EDC63_1099 [Sulfurirhabdus autotrophica]